MTDSQYLDTICAIDVILKQLSEDYNDLKTRTKLTLIYNQQLIELCVNGTNGTKSRNASHIPKSTKMIIRN